MILNEAPPVPGDCVLSCLKSESDAEGIPFLKSVSLVDRFRTQDSYEYIGDVDGIFVISSCTTTDMMKDDISSLCFRIQDIYHHSRITPTRN